MPLRREIKDWAIATRKTKQEIERKGIHDPDSIIKAMKRASPKSTVDPQGLKHKKR